MLAGCDWWISIRSVDNMHDWRKFWKRFRGCFVFESRVSTKTVVSWPAKTSTSPRSSHPRRPRGSQSDREKWRDESFHSRAEEPLGTDSHRTISKRSSEYWLLIGHKKCFVLLCPIGEQHLLSTSPFREFVHDGYYLATVARFVHQAFLSRQRNYRWVENVSDAISRSNSICTEKILFLTDQNCIVSNRKFRMRRRRTRNQKTQ